MNLMDQADGLVVDKLLEMLTLWIIARFTKMII